MFARHKKKVFACKPVKKLTPLYDKTQDFSHDILNSINQERYNTATRLLVYCTAISLNVCLIHKVEDVSLCRNLHNCFSARVANLLVKTEDRESQKHTSTVLGT